MKTNRKILSLAISALLMTGVASYSMSSYAKDKVEEKETSKTQSASGTDSDKRGSSDSSARKITICHVPPGNPANKHTIHIAYTAWAAHKLHTNSIGPDYADYLGSCNSKTATNAQETLHVISGCTGDNREALETKVQAYFEPITVADTALDDETVATAVRQCLDKGDSSDSGDHGINKAALGGQGGGHDSVSDSGAHHRIRGCQDKSTGDSSKKYNTRLKTVDANYDTTHGDKDPVVVSDSSLNDSGVWTAYKTCVADASNPNKIDSSKTGKKKGDSGHRQQVLRSCGDTQDQSVRDAVAAYKAKRSTRDIILTASSYNDASIKAAVDACVNAGAKDIANPSFSPNLAIPGVGITGATITNATVTSAGVITAGTITAGTGDIANVIGGEISAGSVTGGTTTGGTTSGGTTTGATITGGTVTGATVFTGVSGRLNFRENTSPIKDATQSTTGTSTSTSTTGTSTSTSTTGTSTSTGIITGQ